MSAASTIAFQPPGSACDDASAASSCEVGPLPPSASPMLGTKESPSRWISSVCISGEPGGCASACATRFGVHSVVPRWAGAGPSREASSALESTTPENVSSACRSQVEVTRTVASVRLPSSASRAIRNVTSVSYDSKDRGTRRWNVNERLKRLTSVLAFMSGRPSIIVALKRSGVCLAAAASTASVCGLACKPSMASAHRWLAAAAGSTTPAGPPTISKRTSKASEMLRDSPARVAYTSVPESRAAPARARSTTAPAACMGWRERTARGGMEMEMVSGAVMS